MAKQLVGLEREWRTNFGKIQIGGYEYEAEYEENRDSLYSTYLFVQQSH